MIYTTYTGKRIIISIPSKAKNIGVALSGGMDSALLLYLIGKETKGTNVNLIPFTIPRPDRGDKYSPKIVEFINDKLNLSIQMPLIFGDGSLPHNIVVSDNIKSLLDSGMVDKIFVAENKVPPISIEAMPPVRSPGQFAWERLILPFYNLTKDDIVDLYFKENIEHLLKLSHSCTTLTEGRCGWCFNCKEREWGFKETSNPDPGIL